MSDQPIDKTAATFAWEALEKKLDAADKKPVSKLHDWARRTWHYLKHPGRQPARLFLEEPDGPITDVQRIALLEEEVEHLTHRLNHMTTRLEDYVAGNLIRDGFPVVHFVTVGGDLTPHGMGPVFAQHEERGRCLAWFTGGNWWALFPNYTTQVCVEATKLKWYKNIF